MSISVTELLNVIKKSGLPLGEKLEQKQKQITSEDTLRQGIYPMFSEQIGKLDEEKKQKIQALANVDKQFSGLFGKGGKYELRNPAQMESLTAGGQNILMQDFSRVAQTKESLLSTFEKAVSKASALYESIKPTEKSGGILDDLDKLTSYGINFKALRPPLESFDDDRPSLNIFEEEDTPTSPLKGTDIIKSTIG